ncbi:hypothetical protein KFK09_006542 [Dendrobium nobile]|uniref:Uncharacterized protein n=1 Tax=Dendrobium nobile TaxID=94219 RepID=A0A8T3BPJ5_DENNO|nr:hypothetical protein KFK09_006542 [Dendrobium nobile]
MLHLFLLPLSFQATKICSMIFHPDGKIQFCALEEVYKVQFSSFVYKSYQVLINVLILGVVTISFILGIYKMPGCCSNELIILG